MIGKRTVTVAVASRNTAPHSVHPHGLKIAVTLRHSLGLCALLMSVRADGRGDFVDGELGNLEHRGLAVFLDLELDGVRAVRTGIEWDVGRDPMAASMESRLFCAKQILSGLK